MGGGDDHENVAAGDAFCEVRPRPADREGRIVDEDVELDTAAHGSDDKSGAEDALGFPPLTSASKSASPLALSDPFKLIPPKLMKSFRAVAAGALLEESSCSFLVCSCSTLLESDLISCMKA